MSILINGMKMPHDCDECKLCAFIPVGEYGLDRKCMPLNRNAEITIRRKDCPLVEIPSHGDLIDRDDFCDRFDRGKRLVSMLGIGADFDAFYSSFADEMIEEILNRPVIIPGESEETNG